MKRTRVLVFGSFDPLHEGHRNLFSQAKALGDELVVVISRDGDIQRQKGRTPYQTEDIRLQEVTKEPQVKEAYLGDEDPSSYTTLKTIDFDILALGYDQRPDDEQVEKILENIGKGDKAVVRLKPYKPQEYKSSFFRA